MKNIIAQSIIFSSVIPKQKFDSEITYRKNKYNIEIDYRGHVLLFNTLTRELIALNPEEYKSLNNLVDKTLLSQLTEKYFYVPNDFNEDKLFTQVFNLTSLLNSNNNTFTHFTVMPTMDCNARCFYCFEHGSRRYPMSDKTAIDVADFIARKSNGKKIKILWFGGEPLYNVKAIDIITSELSKKKLVYTSSMISNGYLLDENIAERAKSDWNLNFVQITLDGTEEIYNKTKAYIYKVDKSPFNTVLNNIEITLKNGIKVCIRLNMSTQNRDDLNKLVKQLFKRFDNYKSLLSIYVWLLYDNRGKVKNIKSDSERHELTNALIKLEDEIYKHGFGNKALPDKDNKINMCSADSSKNVTVLPDGKIGKCDHYSESKLIGDIYNDNYDTAEITEWKRQRSDVELCKTCPIRPQCIRLVNCPERGNFDCDVIEQKRLLTTLQRQIKTAFDKFDSNN